MKKYINVTFLILFCFMFFGCGGGSGSSGSSTTTCQNYTSSRTVSPLWIELSPIAPLPDERYSSSSAYDSTTDSLIVFGVSDDSSYLYDTWVLSNASGASETPVWTELSTTGTSPDGRYFAIAGYNVENKILVVYGGADSTSILTDLLRLSNANGVGASAWTTATITGTAPKPARAIMTGVYDESTDTIIFFGGRNCVSSTCTLYDETWTIQSATVGTPTWVELAPTGTAPSARVYHSSVYDSVNNRMIIFGGNTSTSSPASASSALDDTWVLTNANGVGTPAWTNLDPTTKPDSRFAHSAVYDSVNDRMTIYAGIDTDNVVMPDVWVLTDSLETPLWIKYNTGSPAPRARAYQSAVYADDNRMVMFGGNLGDNTFIDDTWILQNANGIPSSPVAKIVIESSSTTVCKTKINQLVAIAYDADDVEIPGAFFVWSSSDTSIATVDAEGFVTALNEGSVIITVTINSISQTITLTITADDSGGGGGGDVGDCSVNTDCSDYCGNTGTWASGSSGAASNGGFCASGSCYCCYPLFGVDMETGAASGGRCLSCNEVGTNCDADSNVSCYATDDVCLFYY